MSQPLLVEAMEDLFIPVVVYNNKSEDSAILKAFNEPSWNNPVVRFIDKDGKDIIKRQGGVYSISALVARMISSLKAAKREVPAYLKTVSLSWSSDLRNATFAMS